MNEAAFRSAVNEQLCSVLGKRVHISGFFPLSGGSISNAARISLSDKTHLFLKWNNGPHASQMMEAEIKGLSVLRRSQTVLLPALITNGTFNDTHYIVLEYISSSGESNGFDLGCRLAALHANTEKTFGFEVDNFIGSLVQQNSWKTSWKDFFIENRLEPLLSRGINEGIYEKRLNGALEKLYAVFDDIFPAEAPSLLHGDLWSGNYLVRAPGEEYVIDPAVYYGYREMDISMTRLFGGFPGGFYEGYQAHRPLEKEYEKRTSICNLYPLLVHSILFGGSYRDQVLENFRPFHKQPR